jgi:hypothetical protein
MYASVLKKSPFYDIPPFRKISQKASHTATAAAIGYECGTTIRQRLPTQNNYPVRVKKNGIIIHSQAVGMETKKRSLSIIDIFCQSIINRRATTTSFT